MKNLVLLGERRRKVNRLPVGGGLGGGEDGSSSTIVDICHVPIMDGDHDINDHAMMGNVNDVDSMDGGGGGLGGHHNVDGAGVRSSASVPSNTRTVILTSDGILCKVDERGNAIWTRNLTTEFHDGDTSIRWFDVTWVDPYLVCLSHGGAVVTISPIDGETELVGIFDRGLEAAAWSPDGEVLLMVTSVDADDNVDGDDNDNDSLDQLVSDDGDDENANANDSSKASSVLMAMNGQFEVLAEVPIEQFTPCCASSSLSGNSTSTNHNYDDNDQNKI